MKVPEQLKYTKDHEWIRIEGNTGVVGITDYAQGQLGDIVFVSFPNVGVKIVQGKSFGTIEAVKAVSDLYAPVSGEIVEVHSALNDHPESVNKDPYGDGWMVKVKVENKEELKVLLSATDYTESLGL
jgi:glycine cleavage system H protein